VPALSADLIVSGTAFALSDARDARVDAMLIVGAVLFGVTSSVLRKKKVLAIAGMLLGIGAAALGGSSVPINEKLHHEGPALGLDWFLLATTQNDWDVKISSPVRSSWHR
jgi:hypothetical protein